MAHTPSTSRVQSPRRSSRTCRDTVIALKEQVRDLQKKLDLAIEESKVAKKSAK
jgi:hypothetical protein